MPLPSPAPSPRQRRVRSSLRVLLIASVLSAVGCSGKASSGKQFQLLSPSQTGVDFANTITANDTLDVQRDVYLYNGAGVAVGDVDNDGLPDLFFSGNMVSSRLYLNKGNMRFEDITTSAGVATTRWATGATMVDINDDGLLDIYVSVSGPEWSRPADRANLLFINQGGHRFTEAAAQYGIADTSFTTHAAFLDYDRDGCVDLFLLNNSPVDFSRGDLSSHPAGLRGKTPGSYNHLYHNTCHQSFTDVSEQTGILSDAGFGLGVAVADVNRDGWPDIFISNDGTPNDVLYVNNRDGTFTNKAATWIKHGSVAGMGTDIADFNDDGWPDILQVDMLPHELAQEKRVLGYMTYNGRVDARRRGFRDDYTSNSLQLNSGVMSDGNLVFSEISRLAGVSNTDWSWSPLFADFDNDGHKDILITNGYPKAVNDQDYSSALGPMRRGAPGAQQAGRTLLDKLYTYHVSNFVFQNTGDLSFADRTADWGMQRPSYSYGAAYADLDKDGRLDVVINNIDAPAFIYRNVGAPPGPDGHHYLRVAFRGAAPRALSGGIGAEVVVTSGGHTQYGYNSPSRGFMSTMENILQFGLGAATHADTVQVTWPDGRRQVLTALPGDQVITLNQADATAVRSDSASTPRPRLFEPADAKHAPAYVQRTPGLVDYDVQALLPYLISRHGPAIATGDVNGDGLDDLFVGGGSGAPAQLFIQQRDGSFSATGRQGWNADSTFDDWGAVMFDANGDGHLDLYVSSGGYHLAPSSSLLQDRLYVNDGHGMFKRDTLALPPMLTSTATVRVGDFNGDGRPDLFVGGRLTPMSYPLPTRSYVLRNDGGRFTDVTESVAPELVRPGGMVTDAAWVDFDGDGRLDLVVAGEWMPLTFYRNDGPRFHDVTASTGLSATTGWWFSLAVGDFDHDGKPDLVAGNLGLNQAYQASSTSRFGVYAAPFSSNQTMDVVLTKEVKGKEYSLSGLDPLGRTIYSLGVRFPTYGAFADASIDQMFDPAQLKRAVHYQATTFASVFLHNTGKGTFSATPLPPLAQISPIKAILVDDIDGDGNLDVLIAGTRYRTPTLRADATDRCCEAMAKATLLRLPPCRAVSLRHEMRQASPQQRALRGVSCSWPTPRFPADVPPNALAVPRMFGK
ncbi:MAG: VCBS repeat-containing protein [Gemmatimonadaceae bacterium]